MKKLLFLMFSLLLMLAACNKDSFKRYEKRIVGDWTVDEITSFGIGSLSLDFAQGKYQFNKDGSFLYSGNDRTTYTGKWEIRKYWENNNCSDCSSDYVRALLVSAVDPKSGEMKSEYFDEIKFTSANRFKASITNAGRTKTLKFKRD